MRGKPGTVKRPEAERAIRQLTHDWAAAHGVQPGSAEMPSFSAFHRWVLGRGGAPISSFVRRSARLRMLKAGSTRSCVRLGATRRT